MFLNRLCTASDPCVVEWKVSLEMMGDLCIMLN